MLVLACHVLHSFSCLLIYCRFWVRGLASGTISFTEDWIFKKAFDNLDWGSGVWATCGSIYARYHILLRLHMVLLNSALCATATWVRINACARGVCQNCWLIMSDSQIKKHNLHALRIIEILIVGMVIVQSCAELLGLAFSQNIIYHIAFIRIRYPFHYYLFSIIINIVRTDLHVHICSVMRLVHLLNMNCLWIRRDINQILFAM